MGAIQSSVNSVLGTAAAAAYAIDKSDLVKDKVDLAKGHLESVKELDAQEVEKAKTDVDEKELQAILGEKEVNNPSESNKSSATQRIAQAADARKAAEAAKTAKSNLETKIALKSKLLEGYTFKKGGIIGKLIDARNAVNTGYENYNDMVKKAEGGKK